MRARLDLGDRGRPARPLAAAPAAGGRTKVELRLAYGVAGSGLAGWVAEQVAARGVRGHLRRTLQQLKRLAEYEQAREQAAARRAARAS